MNVHLFLIFLWLAWAAVCSGTLLFIVARPATWSALVDRENEYWVRRHWFSHLFAEKMKAREKGLTMKLLLGINVVFSVVVICVLLQSASQRNFRAKLPPPAPVLRHKPAH